MSVADSIIAERVTFASEGETLVGTVYRPAAAAGLLPGVLVTGSWTTVKEQMPALYARKLARHGFAALAFDFRGWGESGGEPRAVESPGMKIRDFHNAAAYLGRVEGVDPARTGALAVCASAGYVAHAVAEGAPLRSLVLIAAWLHDPETIKPLYGGDEAVASRIDAGRAAAQRYRSTGEAAYVSAYDPADPNAAMSFEVDYYGNAQRGRVEAWDNRFAVMSWPEWLEFDALSVAKRIHVPTLMVHADGAALPNNARRFFAELAGPKELFWTEGAQPDFYDGARADRAARLAAAHLEETLGGSQPAGRIRPVADRAAVVDHIAGFFLSVDQQDWLQIRAALDATVRVDYSSLFGGAPATQPADELVDAWRALLPGFDATQHMLGPIVCAISGDEAAARCRVTATHRIDDDNWIVGGMYELALRRRGAAWSIAAITLRTRFVHGDTELPARASARAEEPTVPVA